MEISKIQDLGSASVKYPPFPGQRSFKEITLSGYIGPSLRLRENPFP